MHVWVNGYKIKKCNLFHFAEQMRSYDNYNGIKDTYDQDIVL